MAESSFHTFFGELKTESVLLVEGDRSPVRSMASTAANTSFEGVSRGVWGRWAALEDNAREGGLGFLDDGPEQFSEYLQI